MERPPKSTTEIILAAFAAAGEGAELTPADVASSYRLAQLQGVTFGAMMAQVLQTMRAQGNG